MEVPQIAQQPDVLPVANPGQERVHEHHPRGLARELRSIRVRNHQTDVVADDADVVEPEARGQGADIHRERLLVVAALRLAGATGTTQVGRDDGVALREQWQERAPHVTRLGVAVQQDHGAALPLPAALRYRSRTPLTSRNRSTDSSRMCMLHRPLSGLQKREHVDLVLIGAAAPFGLAGRAVLTLNRSSRGTS